MAKERETKSRVVAGLRERARVEGSSREEDKEGNAGSDNCN